MTPLDDYLARHYLREADFSAKCSLSLASLRQLVADQVIPKASYTIADGVLHSAAFGELAAPQAIPGNYYHAKSTPWVDLAIRLGSPQRIRTIFQDDYRRALSRFDKSVWRMPDAFDDYGGEIQIGLTRRLEDAWSSFIDGIYCLCVADPSSAYKIAWKETLQEALVALTNDGAEPHPESISHARLTQLISEYADRAMPFAPQERARSSRSRLVDGLLRKMNAPVAISGADQTLNA